MGVVFQSPALDLRLTVLENLRTQGHLYGLRGGALSQRIREALHRVGLEDRGRDTVATLSGGLQRRAEVAKALLHEPPLLVLDEPSTGLDVTSRREMWRDLQRLREQRGTTIILTTHLMDEASGCDRVAILDGGRVVALGTPAALVAGIGGDVVVLTAREPERLAGRVRERFGIAADVVEGKVRLEHGSARELVPALMAAFPGDVDAVAFGKPTLEDVFVHKTGRRLD
jgi:ABC-2 type transport system ATP-binding protein